MRVYKNPEKLKKKKQREEKINKKKNESLKSEYHTTPDGEKIKYIPCDVDHEIEVERKINLKGKNKNNKKFTHRKGKYRKLL